MKTPNIPYFLLVQNVFYKRWLSIAILLAFFINTLGPIPAFSQEDALKLPAPGVMVRLSPPMEPAMLKGIKVHPDNPFHFDFILDMGDSALGNEQIKDESSTLIKYFLASLTIPEKDLWVNLSPYENNRIIPSKFGLTEMGRDLLAEDYMLKQITASLIYPEDRVGKIFWQRVYEEAAKKYGTTNIAVNTFNKVWIVPEKASVYENAKNGTAYIVDSKLKVMLEQDYLSLEKHSVIASEAKQSFSTKNDTNTIGSQVIREIVIPELTKEVNDDNNFAELRQVYNSLILATWYKKKIKESIMARVYADKNKINGLSSPNVLIGDPAKGDIEGIYQRYLKAFKKGVFNYIKEESDPLTQEAIPRKYFSGGENFSSTSLILDKAMATVHNIDFAQINQERLQVVSVDLGVTASNNQGMSGKIADISNIDLHKAYEKVFPDQSKALMTLESYKYYTAIRQRVNPNGGGTIIYGGSGIDLVNVLMATAGEEIFMVDNYDRIDRQMLDLYLNLYNSGEFKSLGLDEESYLQKKKDKGYAHVDSLLDPMELLFGVELQSLKPGNISVGVKNGVPLISFTKDWPGIGVRKHTIYFVKADITKPSAYPSILNDKLRDKEVVGYFQNAGMLIPYHYKDFISNIADGFKDGKGFAITDDYIGNEMSKNVPLKETAISSFNLHDAVVFPDDILQWIHKRLQENDMKGYGWLHSVSEIQAEESPENSNKAMVSGQQSIALNHLTEGQAWVLNAEGKRIVVPYEFLNGLRLRTNLARKLNIEFNTNLYVKGGKVIGISAMPDEKKMALIEYKSTDEKEVTEDSTFFTTAWGILQRFKKLSQNGKSMDLHVLYDLLQKVNIKYYSSVQGQWTTVDTGDIASLEEFLFEVTENIENIASTSFGSMSLVEGSASKIEPGTEIIKIHNHANGNPSPPSAINKERGIGDIYNIGFFKGVMHGLILDTADQGEQLYFFNEPNDSRESEYVRLYNLYWWKDGNPANGLDATEWKPDIRMYGRSVNEKVVLDGLKSLSVATHPLAEQERNQAMKSDINLNRLLNSKETNGGIDLTPANLKLQIQSVGGQIIFHIDPAMLSQLQNASGLYPKVIRVQPLESLQRFLGITKNSID